MLGIILDEMSSQEYDEITEKLIRQKGYILKIIKEREEQLKKMSGEITQVEALKKISTSATIHEKDGKWFVYDKSGKKNLGKSEGYETKEEATKRLQQVEYFKNKKDAALDQTQKINDKVLPAIEAIAKDVVSIEASLQSLFKTRVESKYLMPSVSSLGVGARKLYRRASQKDYTSGSTQVIASKYDILNKLTDVQKKIAKMAGMDLGVGVSRIVQGMAHDAHTIKQKLEAYHD